MSALSAADIASMRETFTSIMPDRLTNARTSLANACLVEVDKSLYEPGLPIWSEIPRWRILQPAGTDIARADSLAVVGMGTYVVIEVFVPHSYLLATLATAYQSLDASGNPVSPIYTNASVKCLRGGTQQGTTRRVRLQLVADGSVGTGGEILPDTLFDVPDADWNFNDVLEIISVDGHTSLPHPYQYRVGVVTRLGELPPLTTARITGLGGTS